MKYIMIYNILLYHNNPQIQIKVPYFVIKHQQIHTSTLNTFNFHTTSTLNIHKFNTKYTPVQHHFNTTRKLRTVLTNRLLKFFIQKSKKEPEKYRQFYEDYALFIREGIVTTPEQDTRVSNEQGLIISSAVSPVYSIRLYINIVR